MQITTSIEIKAPSSAAWDVLGEQFAEVSEWAKSILKSSLNGVLEAGAVRTCDLKAVGPVAAGQVTEELTRFDRESHALTYSVRTGIPNVLKSIENAWTIESLSDDRCAVTSLVTFELKWWAIPIFPLLKISLKKTLQAFTEQLRRRVEGS